VRHRYAVPVKLSARRNIGRSPTAGTDRPVAFFNWHLYHPDEAYTERQSQIDLFIKRVKYLISRPGDGALPAGACAFNKECRGDPKHAGNRIIVVGDTNARNHECAEFAWFLRALRKEFGYAIDVSAAVVDRNRRTFDMHWSGAPLDQMGWTSCADRDGVSSKTFKANGTSTGCPLRFQSRFHWDKGRGDWSGAASTTPRSMTGDSWYPWWAATFQDVSKGFEEHGQRYDIVFLVGRGWAYDDPVLSYKVMPHYDQPSPMNGWLGGGVQLSFDSNCVGTIKDGNKPDKPKSYAPKLKIEPCGADPPVPGDPAIRSDHIPVGARLRVWAR
jgi:hypothetical protein